MKLITIKQAAEIIGVHTSTLRYWLKQDQSPIRFKKMPSGKLYTTQADIEHGMASLEDYKPGSSEKEGLPKYRNEEKSMRALA